MVMAKTLRSQLLLASSIAAGIAGGYFCSQQQSPASMRARHIAIVRYHPKPPALKFCRPAARAQSLRARKTDGAPLFLCSVPECSCSSFVFARLRAAIV